MSIYVHNPPEPNGVPTQPAYDVRDPYFIGRIDPNTFGQCGVCTACPKCWKLTIPPDESAGPGTEYIGSYYLFKVPYAGVSAGAERCTWGTRANSLLPGENPNRGWTLQFEFSLNNLFKWAIYSPSDPSPARWEFNADSLRDFRCLRANSFVLSNLVGTTFPYQPRLISIVPFYF